MEILTWYQKNQNLVANYFEFGMILNVKEYYSNYTIKSWKQYKEISKEKGTYTRWSCKKN